MICANGSLWTEQNMRESVGDAWNNLKRGRLLTAARNIFDSRNLTSLKAVWEDRKWIGGV